MTKICNESVTIPLKIIFEEPLRKVIFPDIWEKIKIIPAHKKEDKTLIIIVLLVYFLFLAKYLKE